MNPASLEVRNVGWTPARTGSPVLYPTSFKLEAGCVLGIVGPNGAGKTTLLRMLYRYYRPETGTVLINGEDIRLARPHGRATRCAVLQEQPSDFALTVGEIALGRTPHRRGLVATRGK